MENGKYLNVKLPEDCMEDSPCYKQALVDNLKSTKKKFSRASTQVVKLNEKLLILSEDYERARMNGRTSYTYFLRLRYLTVEGVRNMYFEYVIRCAQFMEAVHDKLEELQVDLEEINSSDGEDIERVSIETDEESEAGW